MHTVLRPTYKQNIHQQSRIKQSRKKEKLQGQISQAEHSAKKIHRDKREGGECLHCHQSESNSRGVHCIAIRMTEKEKKNLTMPITDEGVE